MRFLIIIVCALFASSGTLKAEYPDGWNYATVGVGTAIMLATDIYIKDITPDQPRWSEPNSVDTDMRRRLNWSFERRAGAAKASDIMMFGVTFPAIFAVPWLARGPYIPKFMTLTEIALINGFLVRAAKFSAARQRPDSYFSNEPVEPQDNLSFYSGHSSLTLAITISSAMMLSERYPSEAPWFWGTALVFSGTIGYLRVASDRHYFTDVGLGFIVGAAVGYYWTRYRFADLAIVVSPEETKVSKVLLRW